MVVYFGTATKPRSRGVLWSIIAPPFIVEVDGRRHEGFGGAHAPVGLGVGTAPVSSGSIIPVIQYIRFGHVGPITEQKYESQSVNDSASAN